MHSKSGFSLLSKYRTELMGLAILWIMLFHSSIDVSSVWLLNTIKETGYGGVDVFLLLSGIGVYFADRKYQNAAVFYKRRLLRILPTYLPVVLAFCLFEAATGKMSVLDLVLNMTTLSFWLDRAASFNWYIPGLLLLYLLSPLYIKCGTCKIKHFLLIVPAMLSALLSILFAKLHMGYLIIFTARIPIFFFGISIAEWVNSEKKIHRSGYAILSLMLLIGISTLFFFMTYLKDYLFEGGGLGWYPYLLITLPLCLLLSTGCRLLSGKANRKLLFLTFCGTHSLEIYIFHEKMVDFGYAFAKHFHMEKYDLLMNLLYFIAALIAAFIWKKIVDGIMTMFKPKVLGAELSAQ